KYIHKYIYKGGDRVTATVDSEIDEIKRYLHGRYIGPTEAVRRLFEFDTHQEQPPVMHLALHLEGQHAVYFNGLNNPKEIRQRVESSLSTLIAFFDYNQKNEDGLQYLSICTGGHISWRGKKTDLISTICPTLKIAV